MLCKWEPHKAYPATSLKSVGREEASCANRTAFQRFFDRKMETRPEQTGHNLKQKHI